MAGDQGAKEGKQIKQASKISRNEFSWLDSLSLFEESALCIGLHMQRRRKSRPMLHSRLQKTPSPELTPARQQYFLAVLYPAVLPPCSQRSLDSTALSNSSMTAFLPSPSVSLVLCSGRDAEAFSSALGMYKEVT